MVFVEVNGKNVMMSSSTFDRSYIDPKSGLSNAERMRRGLAPMGRDGNSVNLHHVDQTDAGLIKEMTATNHRQNYRTLHTNTGQQVSQINRNAFDKWRKDYWKMEKL